MTTPHVIEQPDQVIPLIIEEYSGIDRKNEPVTVGIPFPKGVAKDITELVLLDLHGHKVPLQAQVLDRWQHDQSLKWVLFDFQATVAANAVVQYALQYGSSGVLQTESEPQDGKQHSTGITLKEETDVIIVNTGAATFVVDKTVFNPFDQVIVDDVNILERINSRVVLSDAAGQEYAHNIHQISIEIEGPLRTTVKIEGTLTSKDKEPFARFFARIHFYANSSVIRIEYTIRNPKAAQHPGGLWDLGDEGSIYFEDISFHIAMSSHEAMTVEWTTQPEQPLIKSDTGKIAIYQDSSGGENWKSINHVNRFGKVMHSFCGYRVTDDGELIEEGKRAHPLVIIRDEDKKITGTVRGFWENFPKAIEANWNTLKIRLFPTQYQDIFELQGGEQKTHTIFLSFEKSNLAKVQKPSQDSLNWIQEPLIPRTTPEWYVKSGVFDYITPYPDDQYPEVFSLINHAIEGDNTFFDRREIIDEYGWRNFGELYADHEAAFYKGDGLPVSHYNNQYDSIYGLIIQYVRSGSVKWFILMNDLVRHVIDIDIYHTDQDRPAYSGGLFWHTDHYRDAATSTHRGFSKITMIKEGLSYYGGGPSNEHDYTTGLMYHYYLTGELASKEAAIGLVDWVVTMDDGTKTKFRFMNRRATGFASVTGDYTYHAPGRGAGYSINALLDGYLLTQDRRYLGKADQLIQRCIHPQDDIEAYELSDPEKRWTYTVFLQVIGRYLDLKVEMNEFDYMYCYARESLLYYAKWMRDHEVPFSTIRDALEYPTETWPAQDLRKSNVFKVAAKYSQEPLRSEFLRKAKFFFDTPLKDLFSFETKTLTRPLIILMTNSAMHSYFQQYPDEIAPIVECHYDFGQSQKFIPQLYYVFKIRVKLFNILGTIKRIFGR